MTVMLDIQIRLLQLGNEIAKPGADHSGEQDINDMQLRNPRSHIPRRIPCSSEEENSGISASVASVLLP